MHAPGAAAVLTLTVCQRRMHMHLPPAKVLRNRMVLWVGWFLL